MPASGKPSEWYLKAKDTVVYRLSELIFGSLLAAFVLGFVGFSSLVHNEALGFIHLLIKTCTYLFISAIYTYFTAGLYLYYHTGILTMPTFAYQDNAPRDFALSLIPAIAFGLSMIDPLFLMASLGGVIIIVLVVHRKEQRKVVIYFNLHYFTEKRKSKDQKQLESLEKEDIIKINSTIKKNNILGWLPTSGKTVIMTIILFLAGTIIIILNYVLYNFQYFLNMKIFIDLGLTVKDILYFLISITLFVFVYLKVNSVFKLASKFLTDSNGVMSYDTSYTKILEEFNA